MHTYIMSFQRVCCWFAGAIDLGVLSVRRRHCVGGGAPPVPKYRGAAAGARRWRKVFDLETFDLGVLSGVEPCADVIVSAAGHQAILVGGAPPVPKNRRGGLIVTFIGGRGAVARRRGGGGAAGRGGAATRRRRRGGGRPGRGAAAKKFPKNFVLSSKFSDDL